MRFITIPLMFFFLLPVKMVRAQDSLGNHYLTLAAALERAVAHSTRIAVAVRSTLTSHQQRIIQRQALLPEASVSLKEGYLSNADTWSPGFGAHHVAALPHVATAFSIAADWTIIAGGRFRLSVAQAGLEEQMATTNAGEETQEVKLLVAVKYLDICRQLNQLAIYKDNARLARHRLSLIESMHRQGVVTRNDVLRTQIEINDYELAARRTGNAVIRLNTELNRLLGQPDSLRLIPDSSGLIAPAPLAPLDHYLSIAMNDNPRLMLSRLESRSATLRVAREKAEKQPVIGLYAETNLLRPYVYSMPATDIYYNVWQAGISIRYNLASLYKSNARIKASQMDLAVSHTRDTLNEQEIAVDVKNAYNLCQQSLDELETARKDVASADENYRIVEEKYRNQLALITDLIDATDTRIAAEIRVNDAVIDSFYSWYQLQQFTGRL